MHVVLYVHMHHDVLPLLPLLLAGLQIRNVLEFKPKGPNRGWQVNLQQ